MKNSSPKEGSLMPRLAAGMMGFLLLLRSACIIGPAQAQLKIVRFSLTHLTRRSTPSRGDTVGFQFSLVWTFLMSEM